MRARLVLVLLSLSLMGPSWALDLSGPATIDKGSGQLVSVQVQGVESAKALKLKVWSNPPGLVDFRDLGTEVIVCPPGCKSQAKEVLVQAICVLDQDGELEIQEQVLVMAVVGGLAPDPPLPPGPVTDETVDREKARAVILYDSEEQDRSDATRSRDLDLYLRATLPGRWTLADDSYTDDILMDAGWPEVDKDLYRQGLSEHTSLPWLVLSDGEVTISGALDGSTPEAAIEQIKSKMREAG